MEIQVHCMYQSLQISNHTRDECFIDAFNASFQNILILRITCAKVKLSQGAIHRIRLQKQTVHLMANVAVFTTAIVIIIDGG